MFILENLQFLEFHKKYCHYGNSGPKTTRVGALEREFYGEKTGIGEGSGRGA